VCARERVRSPFAYNGLNYVHTRLAAPTFFCRAVRKRAHDAPSLPRTQDVLPSPPSTPPFFRLFFFPPTFRRARRTPTIYPRYRSRREIGVIDRSLDSGHLEEFSLS